MHVHVRNGYHETLLSVGIYLYPQGKVILVNWWKQLSLRILTTVWPSLTFLWNFSSWRPVWFSQTTINNAVQSCFFSWYYYSGLWRSYLSGIAHSEWVGNCIIFMWCCKQFLKWELGEHQPLHLSLQGSKLWPICSPMRLAFSLWQLKLSFSRLQLWQPEFCMI